jgi:hypothetical protein
MPAHDSLIAIFAGCFPAITRPYAEIPKLPYYYFSLDTEDKDAILAASTIPSFDDVSAIMRSVTRLPNGLTVLLDERETKAFRVPFHYGLAYIALQSHILQSREEDVPADELEALCALARMFLAALDAGQKGMKKEWMYKPLSTWFMLSTLRLRLRQEDLLAISLSRLGSLRSDLDDPDGKIGWLATSTKLASVDGAMVFAQRDLGERRLVHTPTD